MVCFNLKFKLRMLQSARLDLLNVSQDGALIGAYQSCPVFRRLIKTQSDWQTASLASLAFDSFLGVQVDLKANSAWQLPSE